MNADEAVERARRCINKGCAYQLGKGGFSPRASWPWNADKSCDCSGFLAWCIGESRKTEFPFYRRYNGGWLETSAITRDANSPFGVFDAVSWVQAQVGDVLVYGDQGGRQGHIGIVSEVDRLGTPVRVIHCSKGNWKNIGDAIQETGVEVFRNHGAIVARYAWPEEAHPIT